MKNALSEELDANSGGLEPDQGKQTRLHTIFLVSAFDLVFRTMLSTALLNPGRGGLWQVSLLELFHLWPGFPFVLELFIKMFLILILLTLSSPPVSAWYEDGLKS